MHCDHAVIYGLCEQCKYVYAYMQALCTAPCAWLLYMTCPAACWQGSNPAMLSSCGKCEALLYLHILMVDKHCHVHMSYHAGYGTCPVSAHP